MGEKRKPLTYWTFFRRFLSIFRREKKKRLLPSLPAGKEGGEGRQHGLRVFDSQEGKKEKGGGKVPLHIRDRCEEKRRGPLRDWGNLSPQHHLLL